MTDRAKTAPARACLDALLAAFQRQRLVEQFIADYVQRFRRVALLVDTEQHQELIANLNRECLLAALAILEGKLPGHVQRGRRAPALRPAAFVEEMLDALAREQRWPASAVFDFRHDLAMYRSFQAETMPSKSKGQPSARPSPFLDRVALLLDPSLFEQARRAASKLSEQVEGIVQATLKQVVGPSRR